MFTKFKRSLATLTNPNEQIKTMDTEFEMYRANWNILKNVIKEVKFHLLEYQHSLHNNSYSSTKVALQLAILYPQPSISIHQQPTAISSTSSSHHHTHHHTTNHAYSSLAHYSKQELQYFNVNRSELLERKLERTATSMCNELLDKFNILQDKIEERDKSLNEFQYYHNKTILLQKEYEKLKNNGKKETMKEEERRIRNEETCGKLRYEYDILNSQCCIEMQAYWERRYDLLAPIIKEFLLCQRQYAIEHLDTMNNIWKFKENPENNIPDIDFASVLYDVTTRGSKQSKSRATSTSQNSIPVTNTPNQLNSNINTSISTSTSTNTNTTTPISNSSSAINSISTPNNVVSSSSTTTSNNTTPTASSSVVDSSSDEPGAATSSTIPSSSSSSSSLSSITTTTTTLQPPAPAPLSTTTPTSSSSSTSPSIVNRIINNNPNPFTPSMNIPASTATSQSYTNTTNNPNPILITSPVTTTTTMTTTSSSSGATTSPTPPPPPPPPPRPARPHKMDNVHNGIQANDSPSPPAPVNISINNTTPPQPPSRTLPSSNIGPSSSLSSSSSSSSSNYNNNNNNNNINNVTPITGFHTPPIFTLPLNLSFQQLNDVTSEEMRIKAHVDIHKDTRLSPQEHHDRNEQNIHLSIPLQNENILMSPPVLEDNIP